MKAIIKIGLLPYVFVVLLTQCEKEPDLNDPVDIPNQNFINALIGQGIDSNGDGNIGY